MMDLKGKTREEANKEIEKLNQNYGWELKLDAKTTIFDPSKEVGSIFDQSVPAGTVLYDATESSEEKEDKNGLTYTSDGLHTKVSGTIYLTVYTETMYYSELKGLDAYTIAKSLGLIHKIRIVLFQKKAVEKNIMI